MNGKKFIFKKGKGAAVVHQQLPGNGSIVNKLLSILISFDDIILLGDCFCNVCEMLKFY